MSTKKATSSKTTLAEKDEESIPEQDRADTASDAFLIGVDTESREYVHSRIRDCVTRLDGDEHETLWRNV